MDQRKQNFWAMVCHLSTFVGFLGIVPFGNFVMPLVIWLIFRDESEVVDDQGRESLNFQFSLTVYIIGLVIAACVVLGVTMGWKMLDPSAISEDLMLGSMVMPLMLLVLLVLLVLGACFLVLVAAVRAKQGRRFRYPLTIRVF